MSDLPPFPPPSGAGGPIGGASQPPWNVPVPPRPAPSTVDPHIERVVMAELAHEKSMPIAYLCWITLGMVGAHRFYLRRPVTGAAMLALMLLMLVLIATIIGAPLAAPLFGILMLWVLVDAALIPGWVRRINAQALDRRAGL